ncbi:major facilitator superfamily domain-containing protein [Aspergillus taichungensis]|uniref:Major facilitator superfamily domain-containing protein n=1 Tax=Aspergillus taichungensis TaxID=482145 RepID=A0A2J5HKV2_9EURO|nr:major facilitator superfamily domain-containing protein [Aspergillus taichungensis]
MSQLQPSTPSSGSEHTSRAWLTVVGAFFTFFCSVGFLNAFGVFQDYYQSHQLSGYSSFDISWIGSFSTFALFAGAPIAGVLVDRVEPTILLTCGSLAMLASIFMTSLCQEYYQFFLAQAVLLGASMSCLFCPAIATVSRYFHKNKGLAMGVTVGGSSAGGVIWPIVLDEFLNKNGVSFGWTIRIVGFIMLPLLFLAVLTVIPPVGKTGDDYHHHRILTDEEKRNEIHEGVGAHEVPQEQASTQKQGPVSLLKNTTFIVLCLGLAISYLGMFSPFFYATSYAQSLGHSTSFAFYLVSIINAASLVGRILPGVLADRYGHFNLCGSAALLSGVTAFCWTAATSAGGLVVWCLAYGFTSGAIMSLQSACAAHLASHELHGTAVGFLMGSVALTALFGTPISGQLVGSYGYLALSMYAGASLVVGGLLIFVAQFNLGRKIFARQ